MCVLPVAVTSPRRGLTGAAGTGSCRGIRRSCALTTNLTTSPGLGVGGHLAVDDLDRLLEPAACPRGSRRSPTAPVSVVASAVDRERRSPACFISAQPQPSGSALADLVEHVHRPGLPLAQLLDQRDALLQLRLALPRTAGPARAPSAAAASPARARGDVAVELRRLLVQRPEPPADDRATVTTRIRLQPIVTLLRRRHRAPAPSRRVRARPRGG